MSKRILAIGDVHGCLLALDTLLEQVTPGPGDLIITLGDYVDRGPSSRGVLDRLITLYEAGQLVPLRGNHDEMMMEAVTGRPSPLWLSCGGEQTLASYAADLPVDLALSKVPERHQQFLEEDCQDWYETDRHFFVHANAEANLPLAQQDRYTLYWVKLFSPCQHISGKIMVCGHTIQPAYVPRQMGRTICIDTGVYYSDGWLTCLDVVSGQYWQANQRGESRGGWLPGSEEA